jgi:predicted enzyme related to lactoylglutathione lyase
VQYEPYLDVNVKDPFPQLRPTHTTVFAFRDRGIGPVLAFSATTGSVPAVSGLVIFSPAVERLASFYEAVLGASRTSEPSGDIRLFRGHDEVLVHAIPEAIAQHIVITAPPVPRDQAALKPIFDVASLPAALDAVRAHGGVVTDRTFTYGGITRHDVSDPDGNCIQLRAEGTLPR